MDKKLGKILILLGICIILINIGSIITNFKISKLYKEIEILKEDNIQKDTHIDKLKQECETLKKDIDTNYILKDKVKEWMYRKENI